jgi:hypothetical protein
VKRSLRRAGISTVGFIAWIAAGSVVAATSTPVSVGGSAFAPRLGLIAQTFNVAADGTIDFTIELPSGIGLESVPDATLVVTAYSQVDGRSDVASAIGGSLPRSLDSVDLSVAALEHPTPAQLRAVIPLETDTRSADRLQLPQSGVYPLMIEVYEGSEVLAELLTFVHRLPTADEGYEAELPLAMVVATEEPVMLDADLNVTVDDDALEELATLADVLEASAVPMAVRVPPALLAALPDAGPEGAALAERLRPLLRRNDLISAPSLPLDPSLAASAGQQALYTQWLRDGEDILGDVAATSSSSNIAIVDEPLSQAGGALLRDLGARLLVLPVALYDDLPGTLGGFTDSSQLVQIEVNPGVTVDAAVVDRAIDNTLARETSTPVLTAINTTADLLAMRQQIEDGGGDPRRHGITLATPDLSLPPSATVAAITDLLAITPGLRPTSLADLSVSTDQLLNDGREAIVGLPTEVEGSIADRAALSASLALEAASVVSMLPAEDPRSTEWAYLAGILPTSALTDERVATIRDVLRYQYATILNSIVLPEHFSFTLTGRRSEVPVKLRNTSDTALTVKVQMSSPKLLFPDPPQLVTVEPGGYGEVNIRIEARTNGSFGVSLEVLTPTGDVAIGPPVPLTATVTALSGLGNLVTGALLLVLLTWWVRHVRQNKRKRAAGVAAVRHPATGAGDDDDAVPDTTPG